LLYHKNDEYDEDHAFLAVPEHQKQDRILWKSMCGREREQRGEKHEEELKSEEYITQFICTRRALKKDQT